MFNGGEAFVISFINVETMFADKFYHFFIFIGSIFQRSNGMMEWSFTLCINTFFVEIGFAYYEFDKIFGVIDDGKVKSIMTGFFLDFIDVGAMIKIPLENLGVLDSRGH